MREDIRRLLTEREPYTPLLTPEEVEAIRRAVARNASRPVLVECATCEGSGKRSKYVVCRECQGSGVVEGDEDD